MKHFFMKKYIFAILFLASLGLFSLWNFYSCRETLAEMGESLLEIRSFEDMKEWISEVNEETVDEIAWKMHFIELYGYINELLGKKEIKDFRYVKDLDGVVNEGSVYTVLQDTETYAVRVRKLKEYAEMHGLKVLFISPPSKILEGVSRLEEYSLVSDRNPDQDQFLWQLQQNRVPALDLRGPLRDTGLTSAELFFRSDHHWTPEAAFLATGVLVDEIRRRYDDDWDPTGFYCDIENYHKITYPGLECGSIARNAGVVYAGTDDFTLLWPAFETSFLRKYQSKGGSESVSEGDMTETLLELDELTSKTIYQSDPYQAYVNAVNPQEEIVNHNNPDGPSLLVLRDSYFAPMACFLAPMCSRLDMIWSNSNEHDINIGSYLKEKIESDQYDYLLIELYPYSLVEDEAFPYFTDPDKEEP